MQKIILKNKQKFRQNKQLGDLLLSCSKNLRTSQTTRRNHTLKLCVVYFEKALLDKSGFTERNKLLSH